MRCQPIYATHRPIGGSRGVTRLDGAQGNKQVGALTFKIFPKQIYCIEESTCDIV